MTTLSTVLRAVDGYKPGHIPEFYGNGYTTLLTLAPETPANGDLSVELAVTGGWRFIIRRDDGGTSRITGDYRKPHDLTPEVEALIADTSDGDSIFFDGHEHLIEWMSNNWFEWFVFPHDTQDAQDDLWRPIARDVVNLDRGPSSSNAAALLQPILAAAYKDQGIEATIVCCDAATGGNA